MVDAVERGEDPAGLDGGPEGEGMMDGEGDMGGLDE
jgi:hypothetical protein